MAALYGVLLRHAGPSAGRRCLACGMVAHVAKPIAIDRLVATLLSVTSPSRTPGIGGMNVSARASSWRSCGHRGQALGIACLDRGAEDGGPLEETR
jgi:hypothetical protein